MVDNSRMLEELMHIECAADSVLERVTDVLEHFNPKGQYQIVAEEDIEYIHDNLRTYNAFSEDGTSPSIGLVVQEGLDHYVAKVVDAYELQE
jgi:hypothetical protein